MLHSCVLSVLPKPHKYFCHHWNLSIFELHSVSSNYLPSCTTDRCGDSLWDYQILLLILNIPLDSSFCLHLVLTPIYKTSIYHRHQWLIHIIPCKWLKCSIYCSLLSQSLILCNGSGIYISYTEYNKCDTVIWHTANLDKQSFLKMWF